MLSLKAVENKFVCATVVPLSKYMNER